MVEEFYTIAPGDLIYTWRQPNDDEPCIMEQAHIVIECHTDAADTYCYYSTRLPLVPGNSGRISLYHFNPKVKKHLGAYNPGLFHTVEYLLQ